MRGRWVFRPDKIISGGQTGADRGGLLAARDLGIRTGGWAPKGWLTEDGPNKTLKDFGLVQASNPRYIYRTRLNVMDAEMTAIFGDITSSGSKLTIEYCQKEHCPYILNPEVEELREFARMHEAMIVNIAGNRASKDAEIEERVRKIVREAFRA